MFITLKLLRYIFIKTISDSRISAANFREWEIGLRTLRMDFNTRTTNLDKYIYYIYYIFFINIGHTQHCSKRDKVRGIAVSEVFGQITVSDM